MVDISKTFNKQYENQKGLKLLCPIRLWHLSTLTESVRVLFQTHHQLCNVLQHNFLKYKLKLPGTLLVEKMGQRRCMLHQAGKESKNAQHLWHREPALDPPGKINRGEQQNSTVTQKCAPRALTTNKALRKFWVSQVYCSLCPLAKHHAIPGRLHHRFVPNWHLKIQAELWTQLQCSSIALPSAPVPVCPFGFSWATSDYHHNTGIGYYIREENPTATT